MITYSIVQKMAKVGVLATLSIVMSSVVLPLHIALAAPVTGGTGSAGACTPGTKGCDYVALTTIPGATVANQVTDPVKVIKNAYGVAIGIAAVLAVVMIIYAGIEYATVESISGHSDAKDRIMGALVGMGLLLASYIILRTINIDLVNVNLDLGNPIKGGVAGSNLQDAYDAYHSSLTTLQNTQKTLTALDGELKTKQEQLNKMSTDKQGTEEYKKLESEIEALRTEIQKQEQNKTVEQKKLDDSRTNVQKVTEETQKTFCYTARGLTGTSVEFKICKSNLDECEIAKKAGPSIPTSQCLELTTAQSQDVSQYCFNHSEVEAFYKYQAAGYDGTGQASLIKTLETKIVSKHTCSPTPAHCQTLRISLTTKNQTKKANENGFISDLGPCTREIK